MLFKAEKETFKKQILATKRELKKKQAGQTRGRQIDDSNSLNLKQVRSNQMRGKSHLARGNQALVAQANSLQAKAQVNSDPGEISSFGFGAAAASRRK